MAGAVFGEGGVSLFVAGAAFREILIDSRSAKCCICPYKVRLQDAKSKVSKRRVRDDDFVVGSCSGHGRIIPESSFFWRKQFRDFPLTS